MSICAVIAARNEFRYMRVLLPLLAEQGIDVAIIDNDSDDGSSELFAANWSSVMRVEHVPFRGVVDLPELLGVKARVIDDLQHDWVIHMDADEVMEHREPKRTIRDAICEADEGGYNAVNFEEFVFLPDPDTDDSCVDYFRKFLNYYYFAPKPNRLNRAWKRDAGLTNLGRAGHRLDGPVELAPTQHILRHYPVLSVEHGRRKYVGRQFAESGLQRGWHGSRIGITAEDLVLPQEGDPRVRRLERYDSKQFQRDRPVTQHFWAWPEPGVAWTELAELRQQLAQLRRRHASLRDRKKERDTKFADLRDRDRQRSQELANLRQRNAEMSEMLERLVRSRAFRVAEWFSRLRNPKNPGVSREQLGRILGDRSRTSHHSQ